MDTHGILNQPSTPAENWSQDRGLAETCASEVLCSELIFTLQSLSCSTLSIPVKRKVSINKMRVPVRIKICNSSTRNPTHHSSFILVIEISQPFTRASLS